MEFEGVVLQILPEFKTNTSRGEFVKQEVVFEQPGEYARKVCVAFTGDKVASAQALTPGETVKVSFNIESREWNGRWFTEARGWKIERLAQQQPYVAPQQPYAAPQQPYAAPQQPYAAPQQPAGGYPVYSSPTPDAPAREVAGPGEVDDVPF